MKRRTFVYWMIYVIVAVPLYLRYAASYLESPYLDSPMNAEIESPAISESALPAAE